jgi:hypothetical protein
MLFKLQIAGFIGFFVFAILCPLLIFTPKMAQARRKGLAEYGLLTQRYVESFEESGSYAIPPHPRSFLVLQT